MVRVWSFCSHVGCPQLGSKGQQRGLEWDWEEPQELGVAPALEWIRVSFYPGCRGDSLLVREHGRGPELWGLSWCLAVRRYKSQGMEQELLMTGTAKRLL